MDQEQYVVIRADVIVVNVHVMIHQEYQANIVSVIMNHVTVI